MIPVKSSFHTKMQDKKLFTGYCPKSFSGGGLYSSGNGLLLLLLLLVWVLVYGSYIQRWQIWVQDGHAFWQLLLWWCECWYMGHTYIHTCLLVQVWINSSPSLPNHCLWYGKLWGPSQRVVTLFVFVKKDGSEYHACHSERSRQAPPCQGGGTASILLLPVSNSLQTLTRAPQCHCPCLCILA